MNRLKFKNIVGAHRDAPLQETAVQNGLLIDLRGVEKAYKTPAGDFLALKDIDLQIDRGEFVAVVGKSGAGKSTLINMVTGISHPTAGTICIDRRAVHDMNEMQLAKWRGSNVGVIFQSFQLLPMLTCAQNVMLPMDFANLYESPRQQYERALYLLDQVGIAEQAEKLPSAVSGGQRQRVAIARALANDPAFLAADEPTGSLDSKTANEVFQVFQNLVDTGTTILMTTHDRELASRVNRVVRIADGQIVN
ncbi:MAG: ABC transporter ATP-binding protein [Candidatus Promineifilaceae bacterium]|jgi:putative ABC transport system ATP-binding protein